jgi:hypothetical protein
MGFGAFGRIPGMVMGGEDVVAVGSGWLAFYPVTNVARRARRIEAMVRGRLPSTGQSHGFRFSSAARAFFTAMSKGGLFCSPFERGTARFVNQGPGGAGYEKPVNTCLIEPWAVKKLFPFGFWLQIPDI